MKQPGLLFLFCLTAFYCPAQSHDNIPVCTEQETTYTRRALKADQADSVYSIKFLQCVKRSAVGYRFEVGVSKYHYGPETAKWLGNHGGPNVNFILVVKNLNVGFRFKPWTVSPGQELVFDEEPLTPQARLNPIKLDYYVGYSLNYGPKASVEPYVGFSRTVFKVINEEELNKKYRIPEAKGFITGATINRYFALNEGQYLAAFGTIGYAFTDYSKVHPQLDNGYFEWTLGLAFKGFFPKRFYKTVE